MTQTHAVSTTVPPVLSGTRPSRPVRAAKMTPEQLAHVQLIRTRARTVPNKKREAARRAARYNSAGRRAG